MIIATAGHIDHGKSTLVRALTGVDTDRLPEEKARGISIDLGFAYLHGDGGLLGFVDVPGHERFVRNMLAGVAAIDAALLVVAADDGIMPQTVEHVQILDLLGVHRGVAAVTKADRVPKDRVGEVTVGLAGLLAQTSLAGVPVLSVSATTGIGLDALQERLTSLVRTHRARLSDDRLFRLAIDRAFTRSGTGTVVTGAVFDGSVHVGDRLLVSPAGREVRVRGIQIRGIAASMAQAGDRCALALAGLGPEQAGRGDWVVDPLGHSPTQRLEVRLRVLRSEQAPLQHWSRVHLHCGTADVPARVVIAGGKALAPGSGGSVQLMLERPVLAAVADRYIIRDAAARRTIGGGVVLDPFASRRGTGLDRARLLSALESGNPSQALQAILESPLPAVDSDRFRRMFNLTDGRVTGLAKACKAVVLGRSHPVIVPAPALAAWRTAALEHLDTFHRTDPRAAGMAVETLRRSVAAELPAEAFTSFLRELVDARAVVTLNGLVARRRHDTTANAADERLWARVAPTLEAAGFNPPPRSELAATLQIDESELLGLLYRKSKSGELVRIGNARYYPRAAIARLAAIAAALAGTRPDGLFTAADFRDATRIGRMPGIRILEYLDGAGITRRVGDARRLLRDPAPLFDKAHETGQPEN